MAPTNLIVFYSWLPAAIAAGHKDPIPGPDPQREEEGAEVEVGAREEGAPVDAAQREVLLPEGCGDAAGSHRLPA